MKIRTLVLGVLAVGCGLVASVLTAQLLATNQSEPPMTILVAKKPIARGTTLRDYGSLFIAKEVPQTTTLPFRHVTSFEQLRDKARDHLLKTEMREGEPLSLDYLIDRKAGLEYLARPGYNVFGLRATPESSFAGLIQPENHVKVMSTRTTAGGEKRTQILMKNIRVLAVDQRRDPQLDGVGPVPTTISLEVTDAEAMLLNDAQKEAPLALALIGHADRGDLKDRTGERDVPPARPPVAPLVPPTPPKEPEPKKLSPRVDHRLIIREGEKTRVGEWNNDLGRYFRWETVSPVEDEDKGRRDHATPRQE